MQPIIWAFSSMIILMLIITFLPLSLSGKGKFIIILASFVHGLVGLAAISSFPLWETALMLATLVFFTSYFMDKHIGKAMFKDILLFEEELSDEDNFAIPTSRIYREKNNDSIDVKEVNIVEPTILNFEDKSQLLTQHVMKKNIDYGNELQDNDTSILLERNLEGEVIEQRVELEPEIGYLSEIESLLVEASKEQIKDQIDQHEEIDNRPAIILGKNDFIQQGTNEEDLIEDPIFDFLLTPKELAVSKESVLEEIDSLKKSSLQK